MAMHLRKIYSANYVLYFFISYFLWSISQPGKTGTPNFDLSKDPEANVANATSFSSTLSEVTDNGAKFKPQRNACLLRAESPSQK